jgi:hypothetical protein
MRDSRLHPFDVEAAPQFSQPLFRFPGSFHPPLVRSILEANPEAKVVGDAMAGCGTSALVSVSMGRNAVVSDVDPLACLLTRAKCRPVDPGELTEIVSAILDGAGPMGYRTQSSTSAEEVIESMEAQTEFRAPSHVFHWFHPTVARDLARVFISLSEEARHLRPTEMDAVLAAIAASIRRVSRADPKPVSGLEVTSVRREKLRGGLRFDLRREIEIRAAILGEGYSQLLEVPRLGEVSVWRSDARNWAARCSRHPPLPDLQLTSPPYLKAINYARRHKLENIWLGLVDRDEYVDHSHRFLGVDAIRDATGPPDLLEAPRAVLAACARVEAASSRRQSLIVRQYFNDLDSWIAQAKAVAEQKDGVVYVVVGASSVAGVVVDTPRLLVKVAAENGLELTGFGRHRVVNQRMHYTLRTPTRVASESVLRFGVAS